MARHILHGDESPRFINDTLQWVEGNTFTYGINVKWLNKLEVELTPDAYFIVSFFDVMDKEVHQFKCTDLDVFKDEDDDDLRTPLYLEFTDEITKKFTPGKYTYCITLYDLEVRTIRDNLKAEVIMCH